MRTLAIDFGGRRIGLALSDASGKWATPYEVINVTDPIHAIDPICKLIEREDVQRLVVGLPLNMDGTLGPGAQKVIAWSQGLLTSVTRTTRTIDLIYIDERLSTFDAQQQLMVRKQAGEKLTRKRKKEQLDALAAAGFLQAFLDGKLTAIDIGSIQDSPRRHGDHGEERG